VSWRFELRQNGHTTACTLLLQIVENGWTICFVDWARKTRDCWISGINSESSIELESELMGAELGRIPDVVAEMKMENVLLEEREVGAHLREEVCRIIMAANIKLISISCFVFCITFT
jgi:hypothetical protein